MVVHKAHTWSTLQQAVFHYEPTTLSACTSLLASGEEFFSVVRLPFGFWKLLTSSQLHKLFNNYGIQEMLEEIGYQCIEMVFLFIAGHGK